MATTQNVVGSDPGGLVGINLTTARYLARVLGRTADELGAAARAAQLTALTVDVPAVAAARLAIVARWADEESTDIRRLVERLAHLDGGPVRWRGGTDVGFAHPFRAVGWGASILA